MAASSRPHYPAAITLLEAARRQIDITPLGLLNPGSSLKAWKQSGGYPGRRETVGDYMDE